MIKIHGNNERRATASLVPYARNSRTHSEEQIAELVASIQQWGFTMPVLIDEDGNIIAGHGRVMAMQQLGEPEVPIIVAAGWSEAQRRAYVIADNKLALNSEWDEGMLASEMEALHGLGFDLSLTGYSDEDLLGLLENVQGQQQGGQSNDVVNEGKTPEDQTPEPPKVPIARSGDVWILGNHRIMCGDSTSVASMATLMAGEVADMVFTDPPYGMSYGGGRSAGDHALDKKTGGVKIKSHGMILGDDLRGDDLHKLVHGAVRAAKLHSRDGASFYVCFPWRTYTQFEAALLDLEMKISACIVWDKKSIGLGNSHYRPQHEFIFYVKGDGWVGGKAESDVWYMSRGNTGAYVHPTQKPVELIERALGNSSPAGAIVIDCFGGSGSTMIACEKLGRKARLMELDPKYVDVEVTRWQEFTGGLAVLEGSGQSWTSAAVERRRTAEVEEPALEPELQPLDAPTDSTLSNVVLPELPLEPEAL